MLPKQTKSTDMVALSSVAAPGLAMSPQHAWASALRPKSASRSVRWKYYRIVMTCRLRIESSGLREQLSLALRVVLRRSWRLIDGPGADCFIYGVALGLDWLVKPQRVRLPEGGSSYENRLPIAAYLQTSSLSTVRQPRLVFWIGVAFLETEAVSNSSLVSLQIKLHDFPDS